ncbi:MAG: Gfo/Idh/MocA family oxidoreductase [Fusobacteriaceae bacterium]|jgi:predicted dehydrogenase|nr:Gfo/Idh/MocA family oxidoreductase [Fusobacteriaceae bacterium]
MKKINIGLVGCGFAANLHMEAFKNVHGYDIKVIALATESKKRMDFAKKYDISKIYDNLDDMLKDESIDVIDICTPPYVHLEQVKKTILAKKHVMCEKPLTGYFDGDGLIGDTVDKKEMYESVIANLEDLKILLENSEYKFFYAENFVYAPTVQKSREILEKTKNKILFLKGEEAHSGSHAEHAALWKYSGGGSFMRQGCHPLSAVLYLQKIGANARNEKSQISSVIADMGNVLKTLDKNEKKYILADPVDVEDFSNVIVTFSDGTKAIVTACDMVVGGVRNIVEVYTNEGVYLCNITPNDEMKIYNVTNEKLGDIYITEKVENKAGWQNVCIAESYARGYVGEMQNFMECIDKNLEPESGFELAYDTVKVIYAAYLSAQDDTRVKF